MTTGWHLDQELVRRYASGETNGVLAASVEAHLVGVWRMPTAARAGRRRGEARCGLGRYRRHSGHPAVGAARAVAPAVGRPPGHGPAARRHTVLAAPLARRRRRGACVRGGRAGSGPRPVAVSHRGAARPGRRSSARVRSHRRSNIRNRRGYPVPRVPAVDGAHRAPCSPRRSGSPSPPPSSWPGRPGSRSAGCCPPSP